MAALQLDDALFSSPGNVIETRDRTAHPRFVMRSGPGLKIGLIQLAVGQDKAKNIKAAVNEIHQAKMEGAQLVALPECFNCPYHIECFDDYAEPIETGETSMALSKAAKDAGICVVGGSFPERCGDKLFNTCTVWDDHGNLIATHRKVHLNAEESKVFSAGDSATTFEYEDLTIGVGIGSDVEDKIVSFNTAASEDCSFLIYPGAFDMTSGGRRWVELCRRAELWVALVNRASDPGSSTAFGHTMLIGALEQFEKIDENPGTLYGFIDNRSRAKKMKKVKKSCAIS